MKKNAVLWIVQALLAAVFLFSGGAKLAMPAATLIEQGQATGGVQLPVAFIKFIGVCELLGAIGLIVPWLTGIQPRLTPIAAAGLVIIMIGASAINLTTTIPGIAAITIVLGLLTAWVSYARFRTTNT